MSTYPKPRFGRLQPVRPDLWPAGNIDEDGYVRLQSALDGISAWQAEQVEDLLAQLLPDGIYLRPTESFEQRILPPLSTHNSINFIDAYRDEAIGWGDDPAFLNVSRTALAEYQGRLAPSLSVDIRFSPHTWLPRNLTDSIARYEPVALDDWLQWHSEALFGEHLELVDQDQAQRKLRLVDSVDYFQADGSPTDPVLANTAHARYQQWHLGDGSWWPVYGGEVSVRVAPAPQEHVGGFRAAATNSFFPIPPGLSFAVNPGSDPEAKRNQAILTARRCLADIIENPHSQPGLFRALTPRVSTDPAGQIETQALVDALQQFAERRHRLLGDAELYGLLTEKAEGQDPKDLLVPLWNANTCSGTKPFRAGLPAPDYTSAPNLETNYASALARRWFDPERTTEPFAVPSLDLLRSQIGEDARLVLSNYVDQMRQLEEQVVLIGGMLRKSIPGISQYEIDRTVETIWKIRENEPLPEWRADIVRCEDQGLDQDCWILPFGGEYYLVYVVELISPNLDDGWRVIVDAQAAEGRVLGSPEHLLWQSLDYFTGSGDLLEVPPEKTAFNGPASDLSVKITEFAHLHWHVDTAPGEPAVDFNAIADGSSPVLSTNPQAGLEAVNIVVHSSDIFDHFVHRINIPVDALRSYTHNGQPFKLRIKVGKKGSDLHMGFFASHTFHPATITFQTDELNGNGLESVGDLKVLTPSLDREVVYHELAHGLMWLRNRSPFQQSHQGVPFARALLEGYANYLSRSLADRDDGGTRLYARGAYRRTHWGKRQSLDPLAAEIDDAVALGVATSNVTGLTALPAPDIFPEADVVLMERHDYDVGMIWARALWAVRDLLVKKLGLDAGSIRADQLALDAYQRLVGWGVSFEVAAEALIEAAKEVHDLDADIVRLIGDAFAAHGILAERSIQTVNRATNSQNHPLWLAGLDSGLYYAVDDGMADLTQLQSWAPVSELAGVPLKGTVALSTPESSSMLVATEQGIYRWNPGDPTAPVTKLGDWPVGERPTRLLMYGGVTLAGGRRGIRLWQEPTWSAWNPSTNRFEGVCLDMVGMTVTDSSLTGHDICFVASFGELWYSTLGALPNWRRPSLPGVRCVSLAVINQDLYIGAYDGTVYRLSMKFHNAENRVREVGEPKALLSGQMSGAVILRLAHDISSNTLYAGTTNGLYRNNPSNDANGWQRVPGTNSDLVVTALALVDNTLIVGSASSKLLLKKAGDDWKTIDFT